jgi:outer membrane murein-binding lipoprotein Lpp
VVKVSLMSIPQIPGDLASAEDASALSYWRGHMDAKMDDLSRRVGNIESKINNIHEDVQKIVINLESAEAADRQVKGLIKWIAPDSAAAIAVVVALVAVALRFIP